jgi:DNA-binding transcriptional regulator GbsR (MarR family)
MTEMIDNLETMPPAIRRFVLQWGDLGGQWGVNRTVAQIHALLYISEHPLNAEQITDALGVARSNVSNSLKELQAWRIIERVPLPGDRRDHFTAETDVWEIAVRVAAIRKERELDPALRTLTTCLAEAEDDGAVSAVQRERLKAMHAFTTTLDQWHGQMLKVPSATLLRLIRMGDRVVSFLTLGRQK